MFNAANEAAVAAFLDRRIPFGRIADTIHAVLDAHTDGDHVEIAELEAAAAGYETIARTLLREASSGAGLSR